MATARSAAASALRRWPICSVLPTSLLGPDAALLGDVPAVPIGRDRRDFTNPAGPSGRIGRQAPEALHPAGSGLDRLGGHGEGTLLHGRIPLRQRLRHLGIGDIFCPGNQPDDEIARHPTPATGRLGPTVHPAVEHRRHVGGVGQGASGDQLGDGRLDVETAGFGLAQ